MDFDEFNDINAPIRRIYIPGCTDIYRPSLAPSTTSVEVRERQGTSFSQSLKEQQESELRAKFRQMNFLSQHPHNVEGHTDCESTSCDTYITDTRLKDQQALYERFAFNQAPFNPNLPIYEFRTKILKEIRDSPVLVIQGETGCGKSTQVPQFVLDEAYTRGEYCNIVVTQPRRIAAITLAEQVSKERGYENCTLVGYHIGLDRNFSDDTRLTYCTTGVLLEKLIQSKRMDMYTHIILDEIHERDEEMEFLLIAIKRFMVEKPFETKVILMSATIDTTQFAKYFRLPTVSDDMIDAPTLCLTGRRQHSIDTYYLDDLERLQDIQSFVNYEKPGIQSDMYRAASTIILTFSTTKFVENGFSVLVFLPGIHEIAEMHRTLEAERKR